MKSSADRLFMSRKLIDPLIVSGVVGAVLVAASVACGTDAAGMGMRMYRDPETGAIGAPPPGAPPAAAAPARPELSSSVSGLSEEPVLTPAGGMKVNLRGRFKAAVRRDAGPGTRAPHHCVERRGSSDE